jgi:hypothetical protein
MAKFNRQWTKSVSNIKWLRAIFPLRKRMKIQAGQVFAIKTKIGFGFLQYIKPDEDGIEIVRVLEPIKEVNELSQAEVDMQERYTVIDFKN